MSTRHQNICDDKKKSIIAQILCLVTNSWNFFSISSLSLSILRSSLREFFPPLLSVSSHFPGLSEFLLALLGVSMQTHLVTHFYWAAPSLTWWQLMVHSDRTKFLSMWIFLIRKYFVCFVKDFDSAIIILRIEEEESPGYFFLPQNAALTLI